MKIGIHHRLGSFSENWIEYCEENNVSYKIVNCYSSSIIQDLDDCDALMWHWYQGDHKDTLFARQLIYSLESAGKKVFPDTQTCFTFDDKIGQKYLLEAINAPLVPSHVFYDKNGALEWIKNTDFPKVFKLRGGAGSVNVKLVRNVNEAKSLVNKAFGNGFAARDRFNAFNDYILRFKKDLNLKSTISLIRGFGRLLIPSELERLHGREKGYIYFQDFFDGNKFDIRITVIGDKCLAVRRYCRKNDFRASGSGIIEFSPELFDANLLNIAFETAEKLKLQAVAFDFILDGNNTPFIVEMSYGYSPKVYEDCPGYYDRDFKWHENKEVAKHFIIKNFIRSID